MVRRIPRPSDRGRDLTARDEPALRATSTERARRAATLATGLLLAGLAVRTSVRELAHERRDVPAAAHRRLERVVESLAPARTIGFVPLGRDPDATGRARLDLRLAAAPAIVRNASPDVDAYVGWTDRAGSLEADASAAGYRVVERLDEGFARLVRAGR